MGLISSCKKLSDIFQYSTYLFLLSFRQLIDLHLSQYVGQPPLLVIHQPLLIGLCNTVLLFDVSCFLQAMSELWQPLDMSVPVRLGRLRHPRFSSRNSPNSNDILIFRILCGPSSHTRCISQSCFGLLQKLLDLFIGKDSRTVF
jgi:hypothetical protein